MVSLGCAVHTVRATGLLETVAVLLSEMAWVPSSSVLRSSLIEYLKIRGCLFREYKPITKRIPPYESKTITRVRFNQPAWASISFNRRAID